MEAQSYRSIAVPEVGKWLRRLLAFCGPGYLVAVGYMDPGNWATDLAAGSGFGYSLLWVIILSSAMALVLQTLCVRLGIATGRDLAQACRESSSRASALLQWLACEVAICATDLAEVIGMAIALQLLFHIPLSTGVALTGLDVLIVLAIQKCGFRYLETLVIALISVIFGCFWINLSLAHVDWTSASQGIFPGSEVLSNSGMLYLAIGIIGATVMPHNLYLHSSAVQTRRYEQDAAGKRSATRYATADIAIALSFAFFVNAAILLTASAAFHHSGHTRVTEIDEAYRLLSPVLGSTVASLLFAWALLASGQSSAITATLAGQIVMEGFTDFRLPSWARRLITRSAALIPALLVCWFYGARGIGRLLVLSQVVLSLQLPFAVFPLIRLTSDRKKMGELVSPGWLKALACATLVLIVLLNGKLVFDMLRDTI